MRSDQLLRECRQRSGLSLRALAERAHTSYSTLSAYEHGRIDPTAAVVDRIVAAAGFRREAILRPRPHDPGGTDRSEELMAVLELNEQFPARHEERLSAPIFGRS